MIGVRAHDFGKLGEAELASAIRTAGFETVQLALPKAIEGIESLYSVDEERLKSIRLSFEENNVSIGVFGCYIEPSLENDERRKEQIDIFLRGIDIAATLGSPLIATETTGFSKEESARETAYQYLKGSVTQFVSLAAKRGVNVGIEPVALHTLNNAKLAKRLIDEIDSPCLKIVLDPVNLFTVENISSQNDIINEAFDLLGEYIAAIHVKDVSDTLSWRPLGEGCVNLELIFKRIMSLGRELPILREIALPESRNSDIEVMRRFCQI